jgi:phosphate starvation-inducible PhoH-like protein
LTDARSIGPEVRNLEFDDCNLAGELFGPGNRNLDYLGRVASVAIDTHGTNVEVASESGERADIAARLLVQLYDLLGDGRPVSLEDFDHGWRVLASDPQTDLRRLFGEVKVQVSPKKALVPKNLSQREYLEAIRSSDLVFGIGPAGTGKTYLAVAMAVAALTKRQVKRLVLTRPAVEAGEKLGFLPGDMVEKVNPYLRPLYDALHDMLDFSKVQEMMESGRIEIAPLAFMRGRTLNDAFIILDEAQNTTPEQMKMFLTRLGFHSKAVVTGDVTQIDLPGSTRSGLVQAREVLSAIPGIRFTTFSDADVIRHSLVARVIQAYDRFEHSEE